MNTYQTANNAAELATKNDLERIELRLVGQLNTVMGELALVKSMLGVLLAIANFAKQFFLNKSYFLNFLEL